MKGFMWVINNWAILVIAIIVVVAVIAAVIKFFKLPRGKQMKKVREWLKYVVTMAEKEYGSKTGQLKLASVYSAFLSKFPWMGMIISYEEFSKLVDDALTWMNTQLADNSNIAAIVRQ